MINGVQPSPPPKVLIVLLGAIGDVCRALPLAVRIKKAWPETKIHWAVEPKSADLVLNHPAIDRVIIFERSRKASGYLSFIRELRAEKYPLVLDLQRHLKSGVTAMLTKAARRIGFHRRNTKEFNWLFSTEAVPVLDEFSPKIQQYQRFGDQLGLPKLEPLEFKLAATAETLAATNQLVERITGRRLAEFRRDGVALIMGSSWESRFWPAEHYQMLIQELRTRWKFTPLLIGGNGERRFTDSVLAGPHGSQAVDLVGQSSLAGVVGLLANVRLIVAPDCGPAHIAAAVGTPVITLFGATDLHRSAPYRFERFALQSTIGCSPCYRRRCPGLNTLCMRELPVEAVCAQIEALTKGDGASMGNVHL